MSSSHRILRAENGRFMIIEWVLGHFRLFGRRLRGFLTQTLACSDQCAGRGQLHGLDASVFSGCNEASWQGRVNFHVVPW